MTDTATVSDERREYRALLDAAARAEAANQAKSEFLAKMSHELRTSLHTIIGFAQLLELHPHDPRERDELAVVLRTARHLLEQVNNVIDVANLQSGQITLSPEPVALARAARQALSLVAPLARERDVELELHAEGLAGDGHVQADRQRLHQVLLNLLANAIQYNRPGGRVDVSFARTSAGRIRTAISDSGIGIAPDQLPRLYEPFERLGAELFGVEGAGLGLTLCRGLVEAMGGTLDVSSQLGSGSTFVFELAAVDASQTEGEQPTGDVSLPDLSGPAADPARILYIEDNVANLALVQRILDLYPSVELIPAMQGTIGLEIARQYHPDLVVLDLHLPDIPGEEALARLSEEHPEIPVVVLTADAQHGVEERVRELGASDYLTKPLDVARFLGILTAHLSARRPG